MWNLNLLEVVDTDGVVMTFAGQSHLDKVGHNAQLEQLARTFKGMLRQALVGLVF